MNFPLFDEASIPLTVKVLVTVVISYSIFPLVSSTIINDLTSYGTSSIIILTVYYVFSGLVLSYLVKMMTSLVVSAGTLMGQQMGLGNIALFDPTSMSQTGPLEKIIRHTMILIICTSGALVPLLKGMVVSFENLSIIGFDKIKAFDYFFQEYFKNLFVVTLLLAAPVLFTNLCINLILGVLSRVVPQINVILISFILSVSVGILTFYAVSDELFKAGMEHYNDGIKLWYQLIGSR